MTKPDQTDANKARKEMVLDIIQRRHYIPQELKELLISKISEGWVHRLETTTDISKMGISVQVIKAVSSKADGQEILRYTADLMALNVLPLEETDLNPDVVSDVRETLSLLKRYLQFRIEKEAIKTSLKEVLREYLSIEEACIEDPLEEEFSIEKLIED